MKGYVTLGTAILFSIFMMPTLASAATEDAEAVLFEYLDCSWSQVGTVVALPSVSGDVNGDRRLETVSAADLGEAPAVTVTAADAGTIAEFLAYSQDMTKGFDLAVGDLDGDGLDEIVTAAGLGTNGHVRILDAAGQPKLYPTGIFPFGKDQSGGAFIATGDIDGDGRDDLVIGSGPGSAPSIQVWDPGRRGFLGGFAPFAETDKYGVRLAVADVDGDGHAEIVASMAFGGGRVAAFDGSTFAQKSELKPFGESFDGGVRITAQHVPNPGVFGLIVEKVGKSAESRPWLSQYVTVDISEQRLRAYEFGREVRTFLVSTGNYRFPTPLGEFSALARPEYVNYSWVYGADNPDNYDLGVIRWNIRIMPHIYIHYAPWHNNFGRRMSHGCVNVNRTNAEWIYNWIRVGAPVTVKS
jgi:hypothetical protein